MADPTKLNVMLYELFPTSLKSLKGFLRFIGYYRKFIIGYGLITTPLTSFLKKNYFHWTKIAKEAFEKLKKSCH